MPGPSLDSGRADVVVIGAGVVGLAVAAELAGRGRSVIVLERSAAVGQGISSRNSQVIHAGLYDPPGSLKATSCVRGRALLYERCVRDRIPHRKLGKLVVAADETECSALLSLLSQARENGAGAVDWLDAGDVRAREPRVRALAALASPESGIVDADALVRSYQAGLDARGGDVALRTEVIALYPRSHGWTVESRDSEGRTVCVDTGQVVNAAGLASDRIAELAGLDVDELGWRLRPCKGEYFSVVPSLGVLAERLIYPIPADAGLGIHLTPDLGGRLRVGPDATYLDAPDYRVDPAKATRFADAAGRYLPELRAEHLQPEMAGIRPKLQGPDGPFRDFVVEESSAHGAPGMVHLIGIESPGLTAAGALAEVVSGLAG
ncbi:MAG: NAD(P)/FAD-dependent oxidoreductase [bacterium]|nr:NAD(P)/FAD-dependent oxidoreductase [bacterium]